MARKNRNAAKRDMRGPLQRMYDRQHAANDAPTDVNEYARQHGDYRKLGEYQDARKALVNRGGTPVARWREAGTISDSQFAAIQHCERLWGMLNGKALVMDLNRIQGSGQGNGWSEQEALDDLHRIKGYFPAKWWAIFESVCRFDEPAGFAGSRLTAVKNEQVSAARTTVQFVADVIAMKEALSY